MAGLAGDHLHARLGHADVLGGHVAPGQRFDRLAERDQLRLVDPRALLRRQHDRLAAAQRQPRHRILEAHAPRQPQRIGDRSVGRRIIPEAHAARRRAQLGRMDRDDRLQPARGVGEQVDAFMVVEVGEAPVRHCRVLGEDGERSDGRPTGLEPATSGITSRRSNQLNYGRRMEARALAKRAGRRKGSDAPARDPCG